MKISCCIPGGSFMPQGEQEVPMSSYDRLTEGCRVMRELGYDAAEATVGLIMALSEDEVTALQNAYKAGEFSLDACNSFIPGHLPIISDEEGTQKLYAFVEDAIARMEGTTCGPRPTSCPDQIAKNLKKALAEM